MINLHMDRFTFKDTRQDNVLYTCSPIPEQSNACLILWIDKDEKPNGIIEPITYVFTQLGKYWKIEEVL